MRWNKDSETIIDWLIGLKDENNKLKVMVGDMKVTMDMDENKKSNELTKVIDGEGESSDLFYKLIKFK